MPPIGSCSALEPGERCDTSGIVESRSSDLRGPPCQETSKFCGRWIGRSASRSSGKRSGSIEPPRDIFGEDGQRAGVADPHFVLMTGRSSDNIRTCGWPGWTTDGNGNPFWLNYDLPDCCKVTRRDAGGNPDKCGGQLRPGPCRAGSGNGPRQASGRSPDSCPDTIPSRCGLPDWRPSLPAPDQSVGSPSRNSLNSDCRARSKPMTNAERTLSGVSLCNRL